MAQVDLRNETDYSFTDISSEKERTYSFKGVDVTIHNPQWLAVSDNGHRVLDGNEICHYVGFDGYYLYWTVYGDKPHFVK